MVEATFVLYVPRSKRGRVRNGLAADETADLKWRERKTLFGSEFYFSGPSAVARQVHATASRWINDEHGYR